MARLLSISNFKRYRPIQALALALVTVVALEVGLNAFGPRTLSEQEYVQIRERTQTMAAPDIQILGDSVARGGLLASTLCTAGISVRNDALAGGSPAFSYLLLRQQLENGKVPRALIIAHSPHTFASTLYPQLVGRFASASELPGIIGKSHNFKEIAYGLLTRFSYVLSYRDQFRQLLKGNPSFFLAGNQPAKSEREESLALRQRLSAANSEVLAAPLVLSKTLSQPFSVSDLNGAYFQAMLKLAKMHGIKVYWISMPTNHVVSTHRAETGFNDRFFRYLDNLHEQELFRFLQKDLLVYPDFMFADISHLTTNGASQFSQHVATRTSNCQTLL